ncbi:MAG: putative ATP-dependent exoDNAse [Frankiales bacterium]|nr:putative ATP-dependent exoDNAse [Frankiales bacterium]
MLSIGKVGGGEGDPGYYIESVAKGHEDYYTGRGEAQGIWAGKGARDRGLIGPVDEDDFIATLTPPPGSERSLLGFDLTFSAPKSVSILYAVSEPDVARSVRDAHDRAVEQALNYTERHAAWTRRGRGGREHVQGDALTIATFRHRSSRAGDPQLHTHSVVVNEVIAEGRATALDGRALYAHGRTAGFLYQTALRDQLTRTVGVQWEPVVNGVAEIKGIDEDVRRAFSRRREEIRAHMARVGGRSAKSAQVSVLETRRAKNYDVPVGHLRDEWIARAAEAGFGRDELHAVLDTRAPERRVNPDTDAVAAELASAHGVTRQSSTFDRRDVLREWAAAHREGATVHQLEALADAWIDSPDTVRLEHGHHRRHLGGARYSTPDMLAVEKRLITIATERQGTGVAVADEAIVAQAVASRPLLADEQATLIEAVTRSGDGVQVIRAAAGTGKTFALSAARDAWEQSGVPVYGCALAARAAVEMETLAGIDATTIARLRQDIAHGYGLTPGSVLIVDEAGMVGSRALLELAEHAADTDSKLLLVGDNHQLPELDAGGGFRELAGRLGAVELLHVRRQVHEWDREALAHLRNGRIADWAQAYQDHGRITARPTAADTRQALVDDWWETARTGTGDALMIAHRRTDVADLNALARQRMHRDGRLSEQELITATGRAFAIGDRVVAKRNDRRLGLVNGTRAEVVALDPEHHSLTLRTGPDAEVRVDSPYLDDEYLEHGYALTAHAAQGATVDHSYILGSDELYREWGYTALTRHRAEARFYIVSPGSTERALPGLEPPDDTLTQDVVSMLHSSHRKRTAQEVQQHGHGTPEQDVTAIAQAEAADALERARELETRRDALPIWRRTQRAELTRMATAHSDAVLRWTEKAAELTASVEVPAAQDATGVPRVDRDAMRHAAANPSLVLEQRIGPRPQAFKDRETWTRAATRLMATPTLDLQAPPTTDLADELGIDR